MIWYYLVHDNFFMSGLDWGTIINDPMLIKDILEDLCHYIERIGCSVLGLCPSRITGNSGTWEFFLKIKCNDTHSGINYIDEIASAIEVVKGIKVFKKYDY